MHQRGRRIGIALIVGAVGIWVIERVAEASWPTLVSHHPAVLVAATSHLFPQLLFAAGRLPTGTFVAILAAHAAVVTTVGYAAGRRLGEPAVLRLLGRLGSASSAARALRAVRRIGVPLTALSPVTTVSLLVGAVETPALPFAIAVVVAIILRAVVLTVVREALGTSLDHALTWVNHWQWPIVAASTALVVLTVLAQRRRRPEAGVAAPE